ncbi:hypothetical protein D3C78_1921940 [compost metagenome]
MEAAVAAQAQADAVIHSEVLSQPTGAQSEAAVGVPLLTDDQFQHAIAGNRGD